MSWLSSLRQRFGLVKSTRKPHRPRPLTGFEQLEDRIVPAGLLDDPILDLDPADGVPGRDVVIGTSYLQLNGAQAITPLTQFVGLAGHAPPIAGKPTDIFGPTSGDLFASMPPGSLVGTGNEWFASLPKPVALGVGQKAGAGVAADVPSTGASNPSIITPPQPATSPRATSPLPADVIARLGLTMPPADPTATAAPEFGGQATPIQVVQAGWLGRPWEGSTTAVQTSSVVGLQSLATVAENTHSASGPLADDVLYTVGFESAEGYSTGFIASQVGWSHFSNNTTQPVIATTHPGTGSQHLHCRACGGGPGVCCRRL